MAFPFDVRKDGLSSNSSAMSVDKALRLHRDAIGSRRRLMKEICMFNKCGYLTILRKTHTHTHTHTYTAQITAERAVAVAAQSRVIRKSASQTWPDDTPLEAVPPHPSL